MVNFLLILSIFLISIHPNLGTIPCKFIIDEMENFSLNFPVDLQIFGQNVWKAGQKTEEFIEELVNEFAHQIFDSTFITKIETMQKEVRNYLKRGKGFGGILEKLDEINFNEKNLNGLRQAKNDIEKRKKFVDELIHLHEKGKRFLDGLRKILQIRVPLEYFSILNQQIEKQGEKIKRTINEVFAGGEGFNEIWKIIQEKKAELREEYSKKAKGLSENAKKYFRALPGNYRKNHKMLEEAISEENSLLDKVELEEMEENGEEGIREIVANFEDMKRKIDEAIEEMPKLIAKNSYFAGEEKEYEHYRSNQMLIRACRLMHNQIAAITEGNESELVNNFSLANIRWLAEFILEKLDKMQIHPIFIGDDNSEELPKALIIDENKMEAKETLIQDSIILIAQNMLFIASKLQKIYDMDKAIGQISGHLESGRRIQNMAGKKEEIEKLVNRGMAPENISQFYYQKYENVHFRIREQQQRAIKAKRAGQNSIVKKAEIGHSKKEGGMAIGPNSQQWTNR